MSSSNSNSSSVTLSTAKTVDTFLGTLPTKPTLVEFANGIQKDEGMRKTIPDIDNQADALRRFAEGKMSYAEMRGLCG